MARLLNYRTAIVTLDWLIENVLPTMIATGTALPGLRPAGSGTLICIKPAISPGAGPARKCVGPMGYFSAMLTGAPGIQAALIWSVAVPVPVPGGKRKFT